MKFCKDCVHFSKPFPTADLSIGICTRKKTPIDPVTGLHEGLNNHPFCKAERVSVTGNCGAEARFYQPKQKDVPNDYSI